MASKVPLWTPGERLSDRYRTGGRGQRSDRGGLGILSAHRETLLEFSVPSNRRRPL